LLLPLAVISIAGISVLKSDLLDQADSQLDGLVSQVKVVGVGHLPTRAGLETSVYVVQARNAAGGLVAQVPTLSTARASHSAERCMDVRGTPASPVTVAAKSGGDRWLVIADPETPLPGISGRSSSRGTLVVALDVTNVYDTVGRLIAIDIVRQRAHRPRARRCRHRRGPGQACNRSSTSSRPLAPSPPVT